MRLDHIAYRVKDRKKTAAFFVEAFSYKIQTEFTIDFGEGDIAQCIVLEPPERLKYPNLPWTHGYDIPHVDSKQWDIVTYHAPPEIFISDGSPNSIVGKWVEARNGVGGVHHMAYNVKSVEATMKEWLEKGYAEFTSDKPMECPGLKQCFTKPSELTGVIFEFIERQEFGFCQQNVKALMESTRDV
jgi:4-hydroxyphenylpyruvate dioxygenase-like putative hemolysin